MRPYGQKRDSVMATESDGTKASGILKLPWTVSDPMVIGHDREDRSLHHEISLMGINRSVFMGLRGN